MLLWWDLSFTDKIRFRNWRFFKDDFPNLFFVHPQNDTFNLWNNVKEASVVLGTHMVDKKEHLFMCLNNKCQIIDVLWYIVF